MGISQNDGSNHGFFNGKSLEHGWFRDTRIYGNPHIDIHR